MDLSVYAAWLRGPDISQNIPKIFKKYPKIDYRAFAFGHYAADNRRPTARDIHTFGPLSLWVVKIQGGQCTPGPPDKNIPAHRPLYACARSYKWSSTFLKIAPPPGPNQPTPMLFRHHLGLQAACCTCDVSSTTCTRRPHCMEDLPRGQKDLGIEYIDPSTSFRVRPNERRPSIKV